MQKRIFVKLNDAEKKVLQTVAEANGYKDYHRYLYHQINSLPNIIIKSFSCDKGGCKMAKPIPVSSDVLPFLERLACSHSTTLSSIVHKYIVYPVIKKHMMEK